MRAHWQSGTEVHPLDDVGQHYEEAKEWRGEVRPGTHCRSIRLDLSIGVMI